MAGLAQTILLANLERDSAIAFLKVWPIFDRVRPEPRFQALLKKMNLE